MAAITDPAELGTILGIWAHPDDECYTSGGIMAAAVRNGQRVICVTATRGEAGESSDPTRFPVERLGEIRAAELEASLRILGVKEHHWLDHPDGGCHTVDDEVGASEVLALLEETRPDTVLTFPPDGLTGHVDHAAVSRWTTAALRRWGLDRSCLFFATQTPEWLDTLSAEFDIRRVMMADGIDFSTTPMSDLAIAMRLGGDLVDVKLEALAAQASQVEGLSSVVSPETWRLANSLEPFRHPSPHV